METVVFYSRIDFWYICVGVLTLVALAFGFFAVPKMSGNSINSSSYILFLLSATPATALFIWVTLTTKYTLLEDRLLIRSGPFSWRVDIASIENVTPSNNLIASPALSIDRLKIVYNRNKSILISPVEKKEFISELTKRGFDADVVENPEESSAKNNATR